jgi:hypothetical protein
MQRLILFSAFAFAWPVIAHAGDISVVAGEPALLDVLRDAQMVNLSGFSHGEMQVVVEQGFNKTGEDVDRRVEALVRWDGEECYAIGTVADYLEIEHKMKSQPFELLYNKKRRLYYLKTSKLLRSNPIVDGKFPPLTRLRPDEWWYGKIDGEGSTWMERLENFGRMPTEILRHCRIRRLDDDRIEQTREGGGEIPGKFRTVYSLSRGGNVLEFEMFDPASQIRAKHEYNWESANGGGWYPASAKMTYHFPATRGSAAGDRFHRYVVRSFNPTVKPPRSIFSDSAIHPAPGTIFDDGVSGRRVRIGDSNQDSVVDSLDGLVKEAKSRGFGGRPK